MRDDDEVWFAIERMHTEDVHPGCCGLRVRMLTPEEAAESLGVSVEKIHSLVREGAIVAHHNITSGTTLVSPSSVERFRRGAVAGVAQMVAQHAFVAGVVWAWVARRLGELPQTRQVDEE